MKIYNPHTGWKLVQESKSKRIVCSKIFISNLCLQRLPRFLSKIDEVSDGFYCYCNKLKSLKNGPKSVGKLDASFNELTSLEGLPKVGYYRYIISLNNIMVDNNPGNFTQFEIKRAVKNAFKDENL